MIATSARVEVEAGEALARFFAWDEARQLAAFRVWGTPPPIGDFVLGPPLVHSPSRVTFLLWDSDDPPGSRFPYRAMLVRQDHRGWAIRTIQSQCASCFGAGVVDAESRLCDTCQAEGWGVASGRKRLVDIQD